jgi:hypothetical protein
MGCSKSGKAVWWDEIGISIENSTYKATATYLVRGGYPDDLDGW